MPLQYRPLGDAWNPERQADAARVDHTPAVNFPIQRQMRVPAERQPPAAIQQRVRRFFVGAVGPQRDGFIIARNRVKADHPPVAIDIQLQLAADNIAQQRKISPAQPLHIPGVYSAHAKDIVAIGLEFALLFWRREGDAGAGRQVAVGIAADNLDLVFAARLPQLEQRLNALMRLPAKRGQIAEAPDQVEVATALHVVKGGLQRG